METARFESLLEQHREPVERYIHYKMPCSADADDVVQNTFLAAFRKFSSLRDPASFKAWLLTIAKNECRMYYRRKYRTDVISLDAVGEIAEKTGTRSGIAQDILAALPDDARTILVLYYVEEQSQADIAARLGIPVGTVKSRLHYARERFRAACPPHIRSMYEKKGSIMNMKEKTIDYTAGFSPELPELVITKKDTPFFEVKDIGVIVPEVGNRSYEGTYRYPAKKLTLVSHFRAERLCCIHDADGVKVCEDMYSPKMDYYTRNAQTSFVQMTDEYLRYLGFMYGDDYIPEHETTYDDMLVLHTFLDEGYNRMVNAEDPVRGNPLVIRERPAQYDGEKILLEKPFFRYTTGVYDVKIGETVSEAVGVIEVMNGYATETFITRDDRRILLRWYETWVSVCMNCNYSDEYRESLGGNRRLTINGEEYIHHEDRLYK
ncbi:MAG: sigma-70 family RNA polymerase sigma factor [Clostridia bacterium]|nr:sigma-70 family RNA polymerase sigma factor [Clostridia bacterium]